MSANRAELIALLEDVHAERVAIQTICTCRDCAAEFDLAKARKLTPRERKGHVLDDTPLVLAGAKRVAAVFAAWRKLLLAEIERVTRPTITRKALEWVGLVKADTEVASLDNGDVDVILRRMFGPTKKQRLEELSRPRLLNAIDGYKHGQKLAREILEEDVVLGPVKEMGKALIDNMLSETMKFSETTLQMVDDRIRDELLASVLRGDSVNETATAIGEVFDGLEDYESLRIARTETARAQVQAMTDVYQEQGALFVRWLKSPAACPICEGYDGKIYAIEDFRAHFPAHPNCTCTGEHFDELADGEEVEPNPPWNVFDDEFVAPDEIKKTFYGHAGRPGERGGSLPRGAETGAVGKIGQSGNWDTLKLKSFEDVRPNKFVGFTNIKVAEKRLLEEFNTADVLGDRVTFGRAILRDWEYGKKNDKDRNYRLSMLDQMVFGVQRPHEIWVKGSRKTYVQVFRNKSGIGKTVAAWTYDTEAQSFVPISQMQNANNQREGKLVFAR